MNRLDAEVRVLVEEMDPYAFVGKLEPERSRYVVRVEVTEDGFRQLLQISTIFGDLVHNLRSALDHLVYELARLNVPRPREKTMFPIFDTRPKCFDCATRDMLASVGSRERALIEELQPYHRSERTAQALVLVRQFSNQDKHRALVGFTGIMVPMDDYGVVFTNNADIEVAGRITFYLNRFLEDDAEVISMPVRVTGDDPQMDMHGVPPLSVAFGNGPKLVRFDAIPPTCGEVLRIVRRFRPFFERLF